METGQGSNGINGWSISANGYTNNQTGCKTLPRAAIETRLFELADIKDLVARVKTAEGQRVTGHRAFDSLAQPSTAGLDFMIEEHQRVGWDGRLGALLPNIWYSNLSGLWAQWLRQVQLCTLR